MTVLITGGAGYIGSHMVYELLDRGERVVVVDNLSTGIRSMVAQQADFVEGSVGDTDLITGLVTRYEVDAVIHFAGSTVVPESVADPLGYYLNNTINTHNLISAVLTAGVRHFIFSSTAAVYGAAEVETVKEVDPTTPISPYGRSKLMTEWMLEDVSKAHDLHYLALRYFNVAGADPLGRTGQSTLRATHLIKRACQVALGRVPKLEIFGTDFPTPDGTGVRDYIHVSDLVTAHALALEYLRQGGTSTAMNCGYGHGSSVRQVIAAVERVAGRRLLVQEKPRRPGDSSSTVSDPAMIQQVLHWKPRHDDLEEIVSTALSWESRLNSASTNGPSATGDR